MPQLSFISCHVRSSWLGSKIVNHLSLSVENLFKYVAYISIMVTCPGCGNDYVRLGSHWNAYEDHRPNYSDKQKDILTGLLMSDAWLRTDRLNNRLCLEMINKEYLEYLDSFFGVLSTGVRLKETAEKSAKKARMSGFRPNASPDNYHDVYQWQVRSHPELEEYGRWYKSGKKIWPKNIELTAEVLKSLYVGDGTYNCKNRQLSIALDKESENKYKVASYFLNTGLPEPKWSEPRGESGRKMCRIYWSCSDADELFKYMGSPPPGFGYKWPDHI